MLKYIFIFWLFCIQVFALSASPQEQDEEACEDQPKECDFYWTRGWYTCDNGAALWRYCPRRCGLCGEKKCEDVKESCDVFVKRGYCDTYKEYMNQKCAKSCGVCTVVKKPKLKPGCRDYEPNCPKWVALNECVTNPETMKLCPKGCGVCGRVYPIKKCVDTLPDFCNKYQCVANKKRSAKECMKTCKMCKEDGRCWDALSYCWMYKASGSCKKANFLKFMQDKCRLTCGLC